MLTEKTSPISTAPEMVTVLTWEVAPAEWAVVVAVAMASVASWVRSVVPDVRVYKVPAVAATKVITLPTGVAEAREPPAVLMAVAKPVATEAVVAVVP